MSFERTDEVFVLGTHDGPAEPRSGQHITRSRRSTAVLVVVAVVVAGLVLLPGADTDDAVPTRPATPATGDQPSPGEAPGDGVPDTTDPTEPTLAERTGWIAPLGIAVTSNAGAGSRLLTWEPDRSSPSPVPGVELRHLRFDRSGRWVAGTAVASSTGGGPVLWAGLVGGPVEPVEVGIRGFAWHDSRPGHLAWTTAAPGGGSSLVTVNLASAGPRRHARTVATQFGLRGWGDWGFALTSTTRSPRTTVLDPSAAVVAADQPGSAAGWVPGTGVVVAGRGVEGTLALTADGRWASPAWAEPDEVATDVAAAPHQQMAAVRLARPSSVGGTGEGRVVVVDLGGRARYVFPDVGGTGAITWTADGAQLLVTRRAPTATDMLLVDAAIGAVTAILDAGIDPVAERIEGLAVGGEG